MGNWKMSRNTKYIIYKITYIILRIIEIPFVICVLLWTLWNKFVFDPIDDILLLWVDNNDDNYEIQTSKENN